MAYPFHNATLYAPDRQCQFFVPKRTTFTDGNVP